MDSQTQTRSSTKCRQVNTETRTVNTQRVKRRNWQRTKPLARLQSAKWKGLCPVVDYSRLMNNKKKNYIKLKKKKIVELSRKLNLLFQLFWILPVKLAAIDNNLLYSVSHNLVSYPFLNEFRSYLRNVKAGVTYVTLNVAAFFFLYPP